MISSRIKRGAEVLWAATCGVRLMTMGHLLFVFATCYPAGRGDGGPFDEGVSKCFGVFDLVSKLGRVDFCTSQQRLFLNNNELLS